MVSSMTFLPLVLPVEGGAQVDAALVDLRE
jgi:hypothetical protein